MFNNDVKCDTNQVRELLDKVEQVIRQSMQNYEDSRIITLNIITSSLDLAVVSHQDVNQSIRACEQCYILQGKNLSFCP